MNALSYSEFAQAMAADRQQDVDQFTAYLKKARRDAVQKLQVAEFGPVQRTMCDRIAHYDKLIGMMANG